MGFTSPCPCSSKVVPQTSPCFRACHALEGPDYLGRDPAAVEFAGLSLDAHGIHIALHTCGVEGEAASDVLKSGKWIEVRPSNALEAAARDHQGPVGRFALPLAPRAVRAWFQEAQLHVFGREVERGRTSSLQDARASTRMSDHDCADADDDLTRISFYPRGTGIVPNRPLPGFGSDGERGPFLPRVSPTGATLASPFRNRLHGRVVAPSDAGVAAWSLGRTLTSVHAVTSISTRTPNSERAIGDTV